MVKIAQVMVSDERLVLYYYFTNNASYIASWLEKICLDRKEIFRAAADAQRIADYLLAFHPDYAARNHSGGEAIADTGDATSGPSEFGDILAEAA